MKKTAALFLFIWAFASSQNHRFMYEYSYIPDLTNREEVKKELMVLDVEAQKSVYYSYESFKIDSTAKADLERQLAMKSSNINIQRRERPGAVNYRVEKSYPDYKTALLTSIGSDRYRVLETEKPNWTVFPDTEKVGAYVVQKATATFGGREWKAWFTTELPFQDGPYKCHGLPGLIVKLEDASGTHSMLLVGNKKIPSAKVVAENQAPAHVQVFAMGGKELEISEQQFKKLWKDYINDPSKSMREMMMKSGDGNQVVIKMRSQDGREISDPREIFKNMETRVKEMLKKNNNLIEPELYN